MKKAALLLALLFTAQASFAYIEEYTTSDIKTLNGTGYSQETMKVVETARILKQGYEKDYVPFYPTEIYSDNPIVKWYQVAKRYFDPAQDNQIMGVREIKYDNDWFPGNPNVLEKKSPNNKYQRLFDKDIQRLETAGKIVPGSNGVEKAPASEAPTVEEAVDETYGAPVEVEVENL